MYTIKAKPRVAPEKLASHQSGFALFVIENNTREVFMNKMVKCRLEECQKKRKGKSTLCSYHEYRWYKYKSFDAPKKEPVIIPDGYIGICQNHGLLKKCDVYKKQKTADKIYYRCKICSNERARAWEKRNPESVKKQKYRNYKKHVVKYRKESIVRQQLISIEEYDAMFIAQNNKCAICGKEEVKKRSDGTICPLNVDHCHITGKTRQLLCFKCNTGIGMLKDDPKIISNALNYLLKWRMQHGVNDEVGEYAELS